MIIKSYTFFGDFFLSLWIIKTQNSAMINKGLVTLNIAKYGLSIKCMLLEKSVALSIAPLIINTKSTRQTYLNP